jgi:peptide/nickel transport system substrate-binding protein
MAHTHDISRRKFLAGIAGASVAALLAACGGGSTNNNADATLQAVAGKTPTAAPVTGATGGASPTAAGAATTGSAAAGSPTAAAAANATPATNATPAAQGSTGQLKQVARNRTLIFGITGNQLTDYNVINPFFLTGVNTSSGFPYAFEAPYYYNSYNTDTVCGPTGMQCKDGFIPWQVESYENNADFTQYTLHVRKGVTWSDGQPFTSKDIAYTLNMLKTNADKLLWGIDMKTWVKDIATPDDLTAQITLNSPNPRFFFKYFAFHQDIGVPIVPEHIWKDQDASSFNNLDIAKGWPVTTGPWKLVLSSPQQRIFDRRDDWWAATSGFHPLPAPERIIVIPGTDETKMVQLAINNEIDMTIDLRPDNITAVTKANPKLTTWSGTKPPYGYRDWWPVSLGFNDMKPPFDDPDIRWAINYSINRDQLVSLGYKGAGETTLLPFPKFPALEKFLTTVDDLAAPINVFDVNKTADIMQRKGYTKNGDKLWTKDGKTISLVISCPSNLFQDIAPIVSQQLRVGGFDASFKLIQGPSFGQDTGTGNIDAFMLGHGGSVRDPYDTLNLYHSRYSKPTGQQATYPYRWVNADYDKLVDQIGALSGDDPKVLPLFRQAMDIWIKAMPDVGLVQWFHRIPTNTTYWTGWPSEENPYINSCYWHRTSPLWINTIKAVQ